MTILNTGLSTIQSKSQTNSGQIRTNRQNYAKAGINQQKVSFGTAFTPEFEQLLSKNKHKLGKKVLRAVEKIRNDGKKGLLGIKNIINPRFICLPGGKNRPPNYFQHPLFEVKIASALVLTNKNNMYADIVTKVSKSRGLLKLNRNKISKILIKHDRLKLVNKYLNTKLYQGVLENKDEIISKNFIKCVKAWFLPYRVEKGYKRLDLLK